MCEITHFVGSGEVARCPSFPLCQEVFGAVWLQLRVSQENLQLLCCTDASTEGFQCRAGLCKPLMSAPSTFYCSLTVSFRAQAPALMNIMCPPYKWGGSLRANEDSFLFNKLGREGAAKLPLILLDLAGGCVF